MNESMTVCLNGEYVSRENARSQGTPVFEEVEYEES